MGYPFTHQLLAQGLSYSAYEALVQGVVAQHATTGPVQSEALAHYTALNLTRMQRVSAHTALLPALTELLAQLQKPLVWVALTESWCGDAAQTLPLFALMAQVNPRISLQVLLRDTHLPVMDAYLTQGSRSIPKVIFLAGETLKELGNWGPRPAAAQELFHTWRRNHPDAPKSELGKLLQDWYNHDKTLSLQQEMLQLLPLLDGVVTSA